jgi:hypothetical protein
VVGSVQKYSVAVKNTAKNRLDNHGAILFKYSMLSDDFKGLNWTQKNVQINSENY